MKRVNLLTKYSVLFFLLLLIVIIILAKLVNVSNEALLVSAVTAILMYAFTSFFIHKEIRIPLRYLYSFSGKLKLPAESSEDDDFNTCTAPKYPSCFVSMNKSGLHRRLK